MLEGRTAEEILSNIRKQFQARAALADALFKPIYDDLTEQQQILLMGPLDEAREAKRAVKALDAALRVLAKKPEPRRDENRG